MELNQEKRFVCKFCNKRYPCGKSLGGHIRTHMNNENSAETEEESADFPLNKLINPRNKNIKRFAGLRDNPKKTKRFSDSGNGASFKEMICKECGKGFRSLKALCGHMSCHSDKERVCHLDAGDKHKLIMDSQSETETSTAPSKRRSKRVKYKSIGVHSNDSDNLGNGSSSVSEIVQEQEEVAMCLMMLSRDSGSKKGLNSVANSSENNSVVLEDKSSSVDVRITIRNAMKCVSNNNKLKESAEAEAGTCHSSENSDSGYFRYGPKKVESDDSVDGFRKNIESKKLKMVSGSGFDATYGKCTSKVKYDLRRNGKNAYYSPQKGSKYECSTCNKTFDSHRALGGHRASHTKVNDCNEWIHESYENSLASDSFTAAIDTKVANSCAIGKSLGVPKGSSSNVGKRLGSKKNKGHECPFCFRVFKSGQALGGHKRSHFVGGSDDRTLVIKQDSTETPALIDLNLPAPVEEDAVGNEAGFLPW
ncbi:hypothetical protein like AT1G26610 [Hibiscus trionum]|uniref:C2H2-type domain-containing protein n=1 Tax=Hibiscus trionum TaxID=183268 RepID=A0A9W7J9Y9_HIBTR|nr:hypothetical protein like AT1G26610 [Hibiscus trionum]